MHDLAVPADQDQPAGQAPVVDIAGEMPVDPGQPPGVEPGLARLDLDLEHHRPSHRDRSSHYLTGSRDQEEAAWTR